MNPLQSRLAALRRRLRLVVSLRGVCTALAALLLGVLAYGLFDWFCFRVLGLETWSLLRAGALLVTVAAAGLLGYLLLLKPLRSTTDDLSLALRVEEQYPILNDSLASTVQFLEKSPAEGGVSPALQQEAV